MPVTAVPIPELCGAMLARCDGLGFEPRHAEILTDHFLDAELRGATGHGVERLRWLASFDRTPVAADPRLVERLDGVVRYDAGGSLGYVALAEAITAELAHPPAGARLVVVSDCFPTGRLGHYADRAAREGLVCLLTATSTPRIAHPEGGPPMLGTNPLCLGLPGAPDPTVVDVSMGRVTYGAVLKAAATGVSLPAGSAVRADGSRTDDPLAVTGQGAGIVPFGADQAYKGFALALLVELLCGALAGQEGPSAVILLARPPALPTATIRRLVDDRRFPGEHSAATLAATRKRGRVDLPDDLWVWVSAGG